MNSIATRLSSFSPLKLLLLLIVLPAMASAAEVQAWLLLNPFSPETLISTDVMEKNSLVRAGWKISGTGALQSEGGPDLGLLHRMVRPDPQGAYHSLVATPDEVGENLKAGYKTEGAMGYVSLEGGPGLVAVYRFSKGDHYLWLISAGDQKWATKNGWTRDKAAFWLGADPAR